MDSAFSVLRRRRRKNVVLAFGDLGEELDGEDRVETRRCGDLESERVGFTLAFSRVAHLQGIRDPA